MPAATASVWQNLAAGAVSGALSRLVTAPFDVAKVRLQLAPKGKYRSLIHTLRSVYSEEGAVGLWRGTSAALLLWTSYTAVQFAVYGPLLKAISPGASSAVQQLDYFVAGAGAGCAATLATYPFDIARTAFAGQGLPRRHRSLHSFTYSVVRRQGIAGLYAGIAPALLQVT